MRAVCGPLPRCRYPRGFSGEQPYWTILGLDGGLQQGLLGEDGAVEVARGGFSVEPFVIAGGRLVSWADVTPRQSLQDGYLPIPSVDWRHDDFSLRITAFAAGTPERSQLVLRYRLANTSGRAQDLQLALAARPLQVNPPAQFLNTIGGVSRIAATGRWRHGHGGGRSAGSPSRCPKLVARLRAATSSSTAGGRLRARCAWRTIRPAWLRRRWSGACAWHRARCRASRSWCR